MHLSSILRMDHILETNKIIVVETEGEYKPLGKWVAQVAGLPQARHYGATSVEVLGKLVGTFRRELNIEMITNGPEAERAADLRGKK